MYLSVPATVGVFKFSGNAAVLADDKDFAAAQTELAVAKPKTVKAVSTDPKVLEAEAAIAKLIKGLPAGYKFTGVDAKTGVPKIGKARTKKGGISSGGLRQGFEVSRG